MTIHLVKCVLTGALAMSAIGCEPQPVVVEPDDDTTVVEERDTVIEKDASEPEPGVDVNVGGEKGIDVEVNGEAENP